MRGGAIPKLGEYLILDNQLTDGGQVVQDTNLLSFAYSMRVNGLHHLMVYAKCQGLPHHIHFGQASTVFSISHFDSTTEKAGRTCIKLHDSLFDVYGYSTTTCEKFDIFIQAIAVDRKICLEDFRFHSVAGGQHCSKTSCFLPSPA